jgi:hypothetical protein
VGFFAFAVLAYSFTELEALPASFRSRLVVLGAFTLAAGGELGTLTATVEVYRKSKMLGDDGEPATNRWDWAGLVVSLCATLGEFLIAFATLLGVQATWGPAVQQWGPVALGLMSALDAYVNFMEFGFYLADYDQRRERWQRLAEEWTHRTSSNRSVNASGRQSGAVGGQRAGSERAVTADGRAVTASAQPVPTNGAQSAPNGQSVTATIDQWRDIARSLNGQRASVDADMVTSLLSERGLDAPSDSTVRRWARLTASGEL